MYPYLRVPCCISYQRIPAAARMEALSKLSCLKTEKGGGRDGEASRKLTSDVDDSREDKLDNDAIALCQECGGNATRT